MTKPSELIDEMVKLHLAPALKSSGFKKKALSFSRSNGEQVEVISLQKSMSNTSDAAKFCINLGVFWPAIHEMMESPRFDPPPKECDCTLRIRLARLFGDRTDFWWQVSSQSDLHSLGSDIVQKISSFGIPWLKRAASIDEAVALAQPTARIAFHILRNEPGQASELLKPALEGSKHVPRNLALLAARLRSPDSAMTPARVEPLDTPKEK